MSLPYLSHELCDDMKPFVRNDPQQSHQVFMLKLSGKIEVTSRKLTGGRKLANVTHLLLIQMK